LATDEAFTLFLVYNNLMKDLVSILNLKGYRINYLLLNALPAVTAAQTQLLRNCFVQKILFSAEIFEGLRLFQGLFKLLFCKKR
jgi:hypothetical protein